MGEGIVKGRIKSSIKGEDWGGIKRNRKIINVIEELLRDIEIVLEIIVEVKVEKDIVGKGKIKKSRNEEMGKWKRRIRKRKVRCIEIRKKRERKVEIDEREGIEEE